MIQRLKQLSARTIAALLLLSPLIVYLQWGKNQSEFLLHAEITVFKTLLSQPQQLNSPFVILPLLGQLLCLPNLILMYKSTKLLVLAAVLLSSLIVMVLFVSVITLNILSFVSVLPFIVSVTLLAINRQTE